MRELHAVMGELLDLLPDVGDLAAVTWDVGRQADGSVGLRVSGVGRYGPELLEAASQLGGVNWRRERSGRPLVHDSGARSRMVTLRGTYSGVPVVVVAWVNETGGAA